MNKCEDLESRVAQGMQGCPDMFRSIRKPFVSLCFKAGHKVANSCQHCLAVVLKCWAHLAQQKGGEEQ